jgi:glycosyltransferase involved in cell wall biosynthesis
MKIVILTTLYNAKEYVEMCLASIMTQTYKNFVCYITDDLSTDGSAEIVEECIKHDPRFKLVRNTNKLYQGGNYDSIIRDNSDIDDEDIIVECDGDDWLSDRKVLERVVNHYNSGDIWIANGTFRYSDGGDGFAKPVNSFETLRQDTFTASHLRTWKAFLWREIKKEDLLDPKTGAYWNTAGDLSFMYPMLEMAGEEHYLFMPEINYIYNEHNPINDHKVNMPEVIRICNEIRVMPQYKKLVK